MRVMLTITGPGPTWTSSEPSRRNPRWKPSATAFAAFSRAVAARYKDQVDRYLIWNEPNQQGWLQPQWDCDSRSRNCTPVSPHVYRGLVRAAVPQIRAADPGAEIVVGELAPIGNDPISENTPIKPLPFLRELALRRRALPDGHATVPAAASSPRRPTRSAITRTRCCWRRTRRTRTPTRRSSRTSSGCSPCWTGCAARAACGSAGPST